MHPILFRIGSFPVGTYGLMMALAFFSALALAKRQGRLDGLDPQAITELSVNLLLAGILGAKLLMVVVDLMNGATLASVFTMDTLRSGGAIHGGIIAGAIAYFVSMRRLRLPVRETADAVLPGVALGQGIGRLGCFFAGCCYGTHCDAPWAITFTNPDAASQGTPLGVPLHPVQLYTLAANLAVVGLLLLARRKRPYKGFLLTVYFVAEGIGRMVTEIWRGDQVRGFWLNQPWLSTGRLTALGFVAAGFAAYLLWRRPRAQAEAV